MLNGPQSPSITQSSDVWRHRLPANSHTFGRGSLPQGMAWSLQDLREVVKGVHAAGIVRANHTYRFKVYRSIFLGNEFIDWALEETACSTREQGITLGQALLQAQLIYCVPASDVFRDGPAFYRPIRDPQAARGAASSSADDTPAEAWSKQFGREREGRKELARASDAALPGEAHERYFGDADCSAVDEKGGRVDGDGKVDKVDGKVDMVGLCLQWTAESKELFSDWNALLTLANRPHPRQKHATVQAWPSACPRSRRHLAARQLHLAATPSMQQAMRNDIDMEQAVRNESAHRPRGIQPDLLAAQASGHSGHIQDNSHADAAQLIGHIQDGASESESGSATGRSWSERTASERMANDKTKQRRRASKELGRLHDSPDSGRGADLVQHLLRTKPDEAQSMCMSASLVDGELRMHEVAATSKAPSAKVPADLPGGAVANENKGGAAQLQTHGCPSYVKLIVQFERVQVPASHCLPRCRLVCQEECCDPVV